MDFFFRLQDHCLHYRFLLILFVLNPSLVFGADTSVPEITYPWWIWPLILLVVTFLMGIVAVLGGVGGRVLCSRSSAVSFLFTWILFEEEYCWWPFLVHWR